MSTTENNKLIAEFMGLREENGDLILTLGNDEWHIDLSDEDTFKFDYDWNWLIPVVNKIYEKGLDNELTLQVRDALAEISIKDTYTKVISFINWYNNQQSNDDLASTIYNTLGINIVTCGDCGAVNLHKAGLEEITCEYCNNTSEICDFPDLFNVTYSLPSSEIVNEMKKFIINVPHRKYGYSFAVITNLEEDEVIDEALKKELFELPEDAQYANIEEFDEEFDNEIWKDNLIKI